jgi:PHP family Zn ribbon phosphoesterase
LKKRYPSILLLAALALSVGVGCSKPDDGMKPEEKQMASRLEEITRKSGGDWNKLSEADRQYMVKEIGQGSEQSARMLLQARAGRLRVTPGGPRGGPPRGPATQP